jgi:hypothetical protein
MGAMLRCLFCKQSSKSSKSVEHIIPESIGNKRAILPAGVVCDKCNNYFACKVEAPVLSHDSMRNIRAWYRVPNKRGKHPTLKGHIAGTDVSINLRLDKNGKLDIRPEKEGDGIKFRECLESAVIGNDFAYLFAVDLNPPKREMSRFLAKMALEAFAFRLINIKEEHDISRLIDESHYDLIRNYARFNTGVQEWPYSRRVVFPMDTQMKHPSTGEWVHAGFGHDLFITSRRETYFVFLMYGVEFVINTGGPSIKGYEEWLMQNNNISPVVERAGAKLVSRVVSGKQKYFLEGEFNLETARAFDIDRFSKSSVE